MKSYSSSRWVFFWVAWSLAASAVAQEGFKWELRKVDGRDYLPVDQISRFYGLEEPRLMEKELILENKRVKLVFEAGSSTCFMNGIKFVFRNPVKEVDGVAHVSREDLSLMLDPVLRPNHIKDAGDFKTVILDPAYGGKRRGAVSGLGSAAEYSLAVAKLTAKNLQGRGYKVLLTREEDLDLSLQERLDFAHAVLENAIFVSIDFGSGPKDKRGIETMTLVRTDGEGGEKGDGALESSSLALATAIHGSGLSRLGEYTSDLGIRRSRYAVLSKVKYPAIRIKGGFLSHEEESKMIHREAYQSALANGIAHGIEKYRAAVR